MKIYSWNVNGLRAVLRKGALQTLLAAENPDILCLQETKAKKGQVEVDFAEYQEIWNSADRPGYSGTAIFTKIPPLSVSTTFFPSAKTAPNSENSASLKPENLSTKNSPNDQISTESSVFSDQFGDVLTEGRLLTAEFDDFYLVDTYVPNSKPNLERLDLREKIWDPALLDYLKKLEKTKPIIICGDFNAAHQPIDLARPESNHHHAGFTDQERQGISNLLNADFIDTFRNLHPDEQRYTWWSHWAHARENNVGWRIDYFFISKPLLPRLKSAEIHENFLGSDHCPISIELD